MRRRWIVVVMTVGLVAMVASLACAAAEPAAKPAGGPVAATPTAAAPTAKPAFETKLQKESYSIGVDLARNFFQRQGIQIDLDVLVKGMRDALGGGPLQMTNEEMATTLNALQKELRQKQTAAMQAEAEKSKQAGEAFLAENKKKEGVKTLPSGLQYKVITEGKGKKPTATDTVEVNYRGTLVDGTEFDSSARNGGPVTLKTNGVIKGWTEALQLMPVGSKWQLFIPSDLAYGDHGMPPVIPGGSTLVFEVELVGIK